jgi:hypothetical protein
MKHQTTVGQLISLPIPGNQTTIINALKNRFPKVNFDLSDKSFIRFIIKGDSKWVYYKIIRYDNKTWKQILKEVTKSIKTYYN